MYKNRSSVEKIKMICSQSFSIFQIAALSEHPTEYAIVDLGQAQSVGYIETKHWAAGNAIATKIYTSLDNINWTFMGEVYPDALKNIATIPDDPIMARYVKVEHTVIEVDWVAKVYIFEIKVYDKHGPFGPYPTPAQSPTTIADIIGVNGLWAWGYPNNCSTSLPQGKGPELFNKFSTHARNYHDLQVETCDPDILPDYSSKEDFFFNEDEY